MQNDTAQQRLTDQWPFSPVNQQAEASVAHRGDRQGDRAGADGDELAGADSDELVARLRARRSTSGVAAAYAATHGHPADPRTERGAARWALTGTTAVVAVVAVLLLGVTVAVFSMGGDEVTELAQLGGADEEAGSAEGAEPATDPVGGQGTASAGGSGGPAMSGSPSAHDGLLVHVVGEVTEPGLVTVPDGARVADAVRAAGGATRRADLTALNLARAVVDGEQLYVPTPGEAAPDPASGAAGGSEGSAGASGQGAEAGAAGGTVDINAADAAALEALPGVGPSIAQAIVEWREANGPFANVDELEDVPGIGPATLDEIRTVARVGP